MNRLRTLSLACLGTLLAGAEETAPAPAPAPAEPTPGTTTSSGTASASPYRTLSLEELMDVEVTTVSRSPVPLGQSASAVQVIDNESIRRSGATSLPEALRLAPNLQVAQVNSSQWAISSRGFNNVLANKMLVMIDGRTVYTPLYAGVFWDVQDVLLEDIAQIEVVSGPGGTLWGANAVDGVINVVSKSAADTQGLYASASVGSAEHNTAALRYGLELAPELYARVYGQHSERGGALHADGDYAGDDWGMSQGGFRVDWQPGTDMLTLQGDTYRGDPDPNGEPVDVRGGNLLSRWQHSFSRTADIQLQAYGDWTMRDFNNGFREKLNTYDLDFQNRFKLGPHGVVWGLGYRTMDDIEDNLALFGFTPAQRVLHLTSAFVQDELEVVEHLLTFTVGSKFEHNDYTGFEYQPSAKLALTPDKRNTFWAAVSRAVRTPSRFDSDFSVSLAPGLVFLQGGGEQVESEKLLAYEAGWRGQPLERVSLSLSGFYNLYDDLRTAEPGGPPFGIPVTIANGLSGNTLGVELSCEVEAAAWWRLRGGCTLMRKQLELDATSHDTNNGTAESDDPEAQYLVQSMLDLPWNCTFDGVLRYVAALPDPHVPGYFGLDLRLSARPYDALEVALVGQNLLDGSHPEFIPGSPEAREVGRSVHGDLTVRW